MRALDEVIEAGRRLHDQVMALDRAKSGVAHAALEARLDPMFAAFCGTGAIGIRVDIRFADVHAMMGHAWHTELAYVVLDGAQATFHFHPRLAGSASPDAGFVFIAKSWPLLLVLARALDREPGLRGRFVFEIGDNGGMAGVSFCSSHPGACLIPDYDFVLSNGYAPFRALCERGPVAWAERDTRVFWRGSTTGPRLRPPPSPGQPDDLGWLARLRLCRVAADAAVAPLFDVGVTNTVQVPEPHLVAMIGRAGFLKARVPRERFMQYRHVVDIDGNSNAWSGLFCSLLGGSCVLKVASPSGCRQWYYGALVAWRDFIPVASDLSDLVASVAWALDHPDHAGQIAGRGRDLAVAMTMEHAVEESASGLIRWLAAA